MSLHDISIHLDNSRRVDGDTNKIHFSPLCVCLEGEEGVRGNNWHMFLLVTKNNYTIIKIYSYHHNIC